MAKENKEPGRIKQLIKIYQSTMAVKNVVKLSPELIAEAERLGFRSIWTAEAYGSDAATILGWIAGQTTKRAQYVV